MTILKYILISARPKQWVKNLLIFAPLVFSANIFNPRMVAQTGVIFVLFTLVVGGVYIINDIMDKDEDALHPTKRLRPIARGALSVKMGSLAAAILILAGTTSVFFVHTQTAELFVLYASLNLAYSAKFKDIAILDAIFIGIGFVLRIFIGALYASILVTPWILAMVFLLSVFLVFSKRRQELVVLGTTSPEHRTSLANYSTAFIDQALSLTASAIFVFYLLYTLDPAISLKFHTNQLFLTSPFVLFGLLRYLHSVNKESVADSPLDLLFHDKLLVANVLLWLAVFLFIIY